MPTPTTLEPQALLRLLACASPAFPTGGFAYSQGLEWAVEAGQVHNQTTLLAWLQDVLHHGTARSDAILLRHAHRAAHHPPTRATLSTIAHATALPAERQADSAAQGTAFQTSTAPWEPPVKNASPPPCGEGQGGGAHPPHPTPYPIAFATFTATQSIEEDAACLGYLANWAANSISAAIRLGVLGQAGGLRVLHALEPALQEIAESTKSATLDDLGGTCFWADIAAMRHETQTTRLFRS